jgi:hypothetical protein
MVHPGNDEFKQRGPEVSGQWIAKPNWAGLTAKDVGITVPDALWMQNPTTGSATSRLCRALLQALPAADLTAISKFNLGPHGVNYNNAGIIVSSTTAELTGTQTTVCAIHSTNWITACEKFTNFNGGTTALATNRVFSAGGGYYVRLRRSGANYYAGWSVDGRSWMEQAVTLGFTPLYVGVYSSCQTASGHPPLEVAFDYFRIHETPLATWGGFRTLWEPLA